MYEIVTDSTACFSKEDAERLGIKIIPIQYTIDDKKSHEDFGRDNTDSLKEIADNMKACKTSQPNPNIFTNIFGSILARGKDVLYIGLSSRLSGTISSAVVAARALSEDKITVFDSLSIAGGERLLVEKAVEMQKNGLTISGIVNALSNIRERVRLVFTCKDMDALRRSGRIGNVSQSADNLLNVLPYLAVKDGTIVSVGNTRGINNFINTLLNEMPSDVKKVIINCFDDQTKVIGALNNYLKDADITINKCGPVIAIHVGLNAFGVSWIENAQNNN